jgi:hypothetical protein
MLQLRDISTPKKRKSARPVPVAPSSLGKPKLKHEPADDSLVERIKAIAVAHFLAVLYASADHQAPFKLLITIQVDGEPKPLLLVGTAHGRVEDGSCIAILNPDQELIDKLSGCWGANSAIFKEAVAKKCDLAVALWIDAYKVNGVDNGIIYIAKQPKPAKFVVH